MREHIHKKVFSGEALLTSPPQYPWICSECGEKGIDRGVYTSSRDEYLNLEEKFDKIKK